MYFTWQAFMKSLQFLYVYIDVIWKHQQFQTGLTYKPLTATVSLTNSVDQDQTAQKVQSGLEPYCQAL